MIGEAVVTEKGIEGGAIYALSAAIREALAKGPVTLTLDFRPDLTPSALLGRLAEGRKGDSLANRLRKGAGLSAAQVSLLHEAAFREGKKLAEEGPQGLARRIKACPVPISGMAGLDRAISTAGGVRFDALTPDFMLKAMPGTFVAGCSIDRPRYLLQATATHAAQHLSCWASDALRDWRCGDGRTRVLTRRRLLPQLQRSACRTSRCRLRRCARQDLALAAGERLQTARSLAKSRFARVSSAQDSSSSDPAAPSAPCEQGCGIRKGLRIATVELWIGELRFELHNHAADFLHRAG